MCVYRHTYTHSIQLYLYLPTKRQHKIVKFISWDDSEHKKISSVTFSRYSNISIHTSAIVCLIKDTACTTVRNLTSRLYFSPPRDMRSWQIAH